MNMCYLKISSIWYRYLLACTTLKTERFQEALNLKVNLK